MKERTDETLIHAHQAGESGAFEALVRRYADGLFGFIYRMVQNREETEDIFQETFKRVHEKCGTYAGTGTFKGWLYTIASRIVFDQGRKKKRRPEAVSLESAGEELVVSLRGSGGTSGEDEKGPYETLELEEQKKQLRLAILELPEKQRITLVMVYYQGHSYAQAAEVMGISEGACKSHMYRALRKLAGKISEK